MTSHVLKFLVDLLDQVFMRRPCASWHMHFMVMERRCDFESEFIWAHFSLACSSTINDL